MQSDSHTCARCGYELTGLGTRGRCPECGHYFNHLSGEGLTNPDSPANRGRRWIDTHLRTITILLVGLILLSCVGAFSYSLNALGRTALAIIALLVVALAFTLLASYVDEL